MLLAHVQDWDPTEELFTAGVCHFIHCDDCIQQSRLEYFTFLVTVLLFFIQHLLKQSGIYLTAGSATPATL